MRLREILQSVPGLEKRFVHYLEGQGYIRPAKLQKTRIARRDYSQADLERVRGIWTYYQRGISIQRAFELLTRADAEGAYVFFPIANARWDAALELLHDLPNVVEASAVYGESADVVAHLRVPHETDIYGVLDRLLAASIMGGLPQIMRHGPGASWAKESENGPRMVRAWVLIKVPAKQIGGLVEELRALPGIVEATGIYGETDVIAKIEVDDPAALDDLVIRRIQGIEAVESTRTFIGIGSLHWARGT